jgi:IclR family pca regulon transcriptional regulator
MTPSSAGTADVPQEAATDGGREYVKSVEKALLVIECFGPESPSLSLSEVAARAGITRASARRILLTLEQLGYVSSSGRQFSLRPRVLQLGYSYLSSQPLQQIVQPGMEQLARQLGEACSVAVLDDLEIVYVARNATPRIMTVTLTVGARLPAYCTSLGRVLLAGLDDETLDEHLKRIKPEHLTQFTITKPSEIRARILHARESGYAIVDQEREVGVRSVAVPIFDGRGHTVAAMNISAHASRVDIETLESGFYPALKAVADDAGRALTAAGYSVG